jgi:hypothetical protein
MRTLLLATAIALVATCAQAQTVDSAEVQRCIATRPDGGAKYCREQEWARKVQAMTQGEPPYVYSCVYNRPNDPNALEICRSQMRRSMESLGLSGLVPLSPAERAKVEAKRQEAIAGLPSCDSQEMVDSMKKAYSEGPLGQTYGLRLVTLKDAQDSSYTDYMTYMAMRGQRNYNTSAIRDHNTLKFCRAIAYTNQGKAEVFYTIEWVDKAKGEYWLEIL